VPKIWVSFINICSNLRVLYTQAKAAFLLFNEILLNHLNSLLYFVIVTNVYVIIDGFSIIYHCARFIS
jgi:hypothetical protein